MKFLVTFLFLSISIMDVLCQPSTFSWFSDDEEERFNYISPAKDQGEQGPCRIFTAVAAVEAMCHIYYNKPFPSGTNGTDLSEREIYSWCSGYGGPLGSVPFCVPRPWFLVKIPNYLAQTWHMKKGATTLLIATP